MKIWPDGTAAPKRGDTRVFDGHWVDGQGKAHPPNCDPAALQAVGQPDAPVAFYVNGINCDLARQLNDMKMLQSQGYRLIGIHNATNGILRDLAQCVADKLDLGENGAVTTVKSLLKSAMDSGNKVALFGHSQGALICSRAIGEACQELLADGWSQEALQDKLGTVEVFTAGGASYTYPDGANYHHRINRLDPVAMFAGLGSHCPGTSAGQGAEVETMTRFVPPSQSAPSDPNSAVHPSLLDKCVHGVGVYYCKPQPEGPSTSLG